MLTRDQCFYHLTPVIVLLVLIGLAGAGWRARAGIDTPTRSGTEALRRGDYIGAIRQFSRAQQVCETDIWARYHLGAAYDGYGWQDEALEAFDATWQLAMEMGARAQEDAGRILMARSEPQKAVRRLEKATALNPERPLAWYLLGQAHLRQGDALTAERCLAEAVRLDPVNDLFKKDLLGLAMHNRPAAGQRSGHETD
jgi:Flp pilus assembly protein TadD